MPAMEVVLLIELYFCFKGECFVKSRRTWPALRLAPKRYVSPELPGNFNTVDFVLIMKTYVSLVGEKNRSQENDQGVLGTISRFKGLS